MAKWQGIQFFVLLVVLVASITCDVIVGDDQGDANQFLNDLNKTYIVQAQLQKSSAWDFRKDINNDTEKLKVNPFVLFCIDVRCMKITYLLVIVKGMLKLGGHLGMRNVIIKWAILLTVWRGWGIRKISEAKRERIDILR